MIAAVSSLLHADWVQSTTPLEHILTVIAPLQFSTPSGAEHVEVVLHLPYRQQTKALSTTSIEFSHRSRLVHIEFPKQGPSCTPHGTTTPFDEELFAKALKFKLWTLAQELEAIGETGRISFAGIKA